MRLQIRHKTEYRYVAPVSYSIQTLRLSPRAHDGLAVLGWRVEADGRHDLPSYIDGYGNLVHCHSINRRHDCISLSVEGEVETTDSAGVLRGQAETLPPSFFLRQTALTVPDTAIAAMANSAARGRTALDSLHDLMSAVHEQLEYQTGRTDTTTPASEALRQGAGVCADHAHVFIAGARHLGLPARYVGGYLWTGADGHEYQASHAWAEAHVPDLGWVGFDPANRICPTDAYVRTAIGLDYRAAAPASGVWRGGSSETLEVSVAVTAAAGEQ
jgi:transglutaminase-like putative cysteine protease